MSNVVLFHRYHRFTQPHVKHVGDGKGVNMIKRKGAHENIIAFQKRAVGMIDLLQVVNKIVM